MPTKRVNIKKGKKSWHDQRKCRKVKEPVRVRQRRLVRNMSLYLDVYVKGVRKVIGNRVASRLIRNAIPLIATRHSSDITRIQTTANQTSQETELKSPQTRENYKKREKMP